MKRPPYCLLVLPSLPRSEVYPLQEFKLRVIKYNNSSKLLDIREYITSEMFTGYSPKGISITLEQVEHLYLHMDDIMKAMKENTDAKIQSKDEDTKTENSISTGNTVSKEVVG